MLRELPWIVGLVGSSFVASGLLMVSSGDFIWGGGFASIGLLAVVAGAEVVTCTFDKTIGRMTLKKQSLRKTKAIEHPIEAISGVHLEKSISTNDNGTSTLYRVTLGLASSKRIPLTSSYSTGLTSKQKTAEVIATFLNVKNYGLEGIPKLTSTELPSRTPEEEILYWQEVIRVNSNEAEAYKNLGIALYKQDKKGNKQQAIANLKRATELFKAQGDDEEALVAGQLWGMVFWGYSEKIVEIINRR